MQSISLSSSGAAKKGFIIKDRRREGDMCALKRPQPSLTSGCVYRHKAVDVMKRRRTFSIDLTRGRG